MTFFIHVVDDEEEPACGIRVSVHAEHNYEEQTDADGNAEFEVEDDRESVHLYIDGCDYGELEPEDGASETFHLRDGVHYMEWTIRVLDQDGRPVEGARVSVWNKWWGRKDEPKETESDGTVFMRGLKQSSAAQIYVNGDLVDEQHIEDGESYDVTIEIEKAEDDSDEGDATDDD